MIVARSSSVAVSASAARSAGSNAARSEYRIDVVAGEIRRFDQHDLFERGQCRAHLQEPFEEAIVLDDRHLRLAVVHEVLDLLRGRGVVDRHRCGTAEQHGEVDGVELRTVPHHHDHGVAMTHAEVLQPRGQLGGQRREFLETRRLPIAGRVLPFEHRRRPVARHVGEEALRDVLADDAIVQVLAGGHRPIIARPRDQVERSRNAVTASVNTSLRSPAIM